MTSATGTTEQTREGVPAEHAQPRGTRTGHPAGRHVPYDGQQTEGDDEVEAFHLVAKRATEQHASNNPPRAKAERRAGSRAMELIESIRCSTARHISVEDESTERSQEKERQWKVQQCGATHHEVKAIDGKQEARERADECGPGHAAHYAGNQQHA